MLTKIADTFSAAQNELSRPPTLARGRMDDRQPMFPEERAAEVFRRAAHLQSAAAQELEARASGALTSPGPAPGEGFTAEDLESIAREVGIEPEFVRLALAESGGAGAGGAGRLERATVRLLLGRGAQLSLVATAVLPAPPEAVLESMRRLLPESPYRLTLADTTGDPLQGGVLVFDLPGFGGPASPLAHHAHGIEVRRLSITLRRLRAGSDAPGAAEQTEVHVAADLRRSVHGGWRVAAALGGTIGTAMGLGTAAVLAAVLGPLAAVGGVGAFLAAGALAGRGYGAIYRRYARKFGDDVNGLLLALRADVLSRGAFSRPPAPGPSAGLALP